MPNLEKSSISIERNKNWFGSVRSANIIIDDEIIGKLQDGERKHFPVSPGTHTVLVRLGKDQTKPLNISIDSGKNLSLEYLNNSHLNILWGCILGLMVFITITILQYLNISFIISLFIGSLVLGGFYSWLENRSIVPPIVIVNESLNVIDDSSLKDVT